MAISRKQATATSPANYSSAPVQAESLQEHIALLAYLKSESRGFAPGHELDDWLEAEQELNGTSSSDDEH